MKQSEILEIIFKLRSDVWQIWGFSSVISVTSIGWLISTRGLSTFELRILATILYSCFYLTMAGIFYKAYTELRMAISDLNQLEIPNGLNYQGGFIHYLYNIDYFKNFWFALFSITLLAVIFFTCIWYPGLLAGLKT